MYEHCMRHKPCTCVEASWNVLTGILDWDRVYLLDPFGLFVEISESVRNRPVLSLWNPSLDRGIIWSFVWTVNVKKLSKST